jgi:putative inorganic carbon (HCO3(-)) transporter
MKPSLQIAGKFITSLEIWIVSAAVALSIFRTSLLPLAVLVALCFWPLRWFTNGRPTKRTPVDIGILVLLLMIPVTLWATALPEKTIPQVYRLVLGILFFFSLINWTINAQKLELVIIGLILIGTGLALTAFFSVNWITTKLQFVPAFIYQRFEMLVSDSVHPNVMAGNIVIIIPVGMAILIFAWRSIKFWQTTLVFFATLITTGMLVLTQSRGALLGLGAASLILVVLRWRWGWVSIPITTLGVIILTYQVGVNSILDFVSTGVSIQGIEGRVEIWSRAIYMIQDFSFTGIGMGSFMDVADLLYPFFLAAPGKIEHAHNLFLQVAVDLGIPGLIAWLSIFIGIGLSAWQLSKAGTKQSNALAAGLGAGFLGSQVALIIHGIMDAVTWGMVRPAPLIWGIWGSTLAAWNIFVVQHQRNETTPKNYPES